MFLKSSATTATKRPEPLKAPRHISVSYTHLDLYSYDTHNNTSSIKNILDRSELKSMDIIFGPAYPDQVKPVAEFAKKNNIRLVVRGVEETGPSPCCMAVATLCFSRLSSFSDTTNLSITTSIS